MISHPRETLFVHIPKTGGQSVEGVFLQDMKLGWKDRGTLCMGQNDDPAFGPEKLAHLFGSEYVGRGHITQGLFDRYLKFAIVRHPYDRLVSEYRYRAGAQRRRGIPVLGFDDFLGLQFNEDYSDRARHMVPQVRFVMDQTGACIVDHVLRFETLARDIAPLFKRIFGTALALPHRNRSPVGPPHDLKAAQKALIYDRYRADFRAFGYDA